MMKIKISLGQMHICGGEAEQNLKTAVGMVEAAARSGSRFILFPELWSSGYDLANAARLALRSPEILAELGRLAREHNIFIGGSLLESAGGNLYNTFSWIDPTVSVRSKILTYRKIHLFRLMDEEKWLTAGDRLQAVPAPWGQTGLAICYDLRFPELFRRYAVGGARGLALSAEWPTRRITHWQTLLRARAIENQSFVFGANCAGPVFDEQFGGCSAVVSPWGEVLAEGSPADEELLSAEIDTEDLERARSFLPVLQDRRPEFY